MAKGKLEQELSELKQLLANGLRIKFETTTKEKEFLEEQLQAGGAHGRSSRTTSTRWRWRTTSSTGRTRASTGATSWAPTSTR